MEEEFFHQLAKDHLLVGEGFNTNHKSIAVFEEIFSSLKKDSSVLLLGGVSLPSIRPVADYFFNGRVGVSQDKRSIADMPSSWSSYEENVDDLGPYHLSKIEKRIKKFNVVVDYLRVPTDSFTLFKKAKKGTAYILLVSEEAEAYVLKIIRHKPKKNYDVTEGEYWFNHKGKLLLFIKN